MHKRSACERPFQPLTALELCLQCVIRNNNMHGGAHHSSVGYCLYLSDSIGFRSFVSDSCNSRHHTTQYGCLKCDSYVTQVAVEEIFEHSKRLVALHKMLAHRQVLVRLSAMLQKFEVDECGPVNIIIGDGGNIEGVCEFAPLFTALRKFATCDLPCPA